MFSIFPEHRLRKSRCPCSSKMNTIFRLALHTCAASKNEQLSLFDRIRYSQPGIGNPILISVHSKPGFFVHNGLIDHRRRDQQDLRRTFARPQYRHIDKLQIAPIARALSCGDAQICVLRSFVLSMKTTRSASAALSMIIGNVSNPSPRKAPAESDKMSSCRQALPPSLDIRRLRYLSRTGGPAKGYLLWIPSPLPGCIPMGIGIAHNIIYFSVPSCIFRFSFVQQSMPIIRDN